MKMSPTGSEPQVLVTGAVTLGPATVTVSGHATTASPAAGQRGWLHGGSAYVRVFRPANKPVVGVVTVNVTGADDSLRARSDPTL